MTTNLKEADLKPIGRSMQLSLAQVEMSDQNRDLGPIDEIRGLSRSITAIGLLYPLIVRKKEGEEGRYVIVAGNRRFRALSLLEASTIPCIVVSGEKGDQGDLMRVAENHQRRNLSPLEEAAAVRGLLDLGWEPATVARSLGRSRAWVARRSSLTELSERWLTEIQSKLDPESQIPVWPPSHLEIIARFPAEVQDRMLDAYGRYWRKDVPRLADLLAVTREYLHLLSGAPWRLDDDTIDPQAGACSGCPKKSSHAPELFPEELPAEKGKPASGDKCLDDVCWNGKGRAFIVRKVEEIRREHPRLALLDTSEEGEADELAQELGGRALRPSEAAICKKSAEGAIPALIVAGPGLGRIRYIQDPSLPEPNNGQERGRNGQNGSATDEEAPSGVRTLEERKEAYDRRRRQVVIEAVRDRLRTLAEEADRERAANLEGSAALLARGLAAKTLRLLPVLLEEEGWRRNIESKAAAWPEAEEWEALGKLRNHDLGREEKQVELLGLCWELLRLLLGVCVRRLMASTTSRDNDRHYTEAETLCGLLGLDLASLRAVAAEKIPYAKSWREETTDDWAAARSDDAPKEEAS